MKKINKKSAGVQKPLTEGQRKLVEQHLNLAMNLGRRYAGLGLCKGIPVEDLQQDACLALCIAARRFRKSMKVDFGTFAYKFCLYAIVHAIRNEDMFTGDDVETFDEEVADEEPGTQEPEPIDEVRRLLRPLDTKERQVVRLIYGISYTDKVKEPMSFRQVARKLSLSPSRVHDIYEQAMGKLELRKFGNSVIAKRFRSNAEKEIRKGCA